MKNNRSGQAKIWTPHVIGLMRENLNSPAQKLIFEISLFTGERMGAIVQLKVSDVYQSDGIPNKFITFRSSTRKSSKHGQAKTRQVLIHKHLREVLRAYNHPTFGYLFPSNSLAAHITRRAVDTYWRKILYRHGLSGYSTHSSRRWVINQFRRKGVGIMTIAETMGMTVNTVRHYCDNDPDACSRAISVLSVS